ncbi:MAG: M20/M25/M40 family metallo-hydrolase [Phycisphaerales bacterium]|nr:M20/M25/M40 family metallo-hydrolase [Phycisphaerales bacterium]
MGNAKKSKKYQIDTSAYNFLKSYLDANSPVGFEYTGQKIWLDYIKKFVQSSFVDPYGTAVGVFNKSHPFKVVIEAHVDEISWFVNYINSNGLLYLKKNGGSDVQITPSMRVFIHGKKGKVKGVFGWPAIHLRRTESEPAPKLDTITVDCGASSPKEVEKLGIHVGSVVTFQDSFEELNYDYFIGRALDNRMGGFMISQVARLINENKVKLPFGLYVVNSVQEEIGLRGAEMIARRIKPNVAIITDVTHDTQLPLLDKKTVGDIQCQKGPTLSYAPAVHNKLLDFLISVAEDAKINVQYQTSSRSTGTDTDSFAYAHEGCPSALISLPLKYMHTTVEMVHKSDVEDTIQLMYETILKLNEQVDLAYL